MNLRLATVACAVWVSLAASPAAAADDVTVHVQGDSVVLEQLFYEGVGATPQWKALCASPCVVTAPSDGQFRINGQTGKDIRPSHPFGLVAKQGEVTLEVKPAKLTEHAVAFAVLGVGSALFVVGVVAFLSGWELDRFSWSGQSSHEGDSLIGVGLIAAATGVVVALLGVGGIVETNATRVRQTHPLWPSALESSRPRSSAMALPSTTGVPIFTMSF